MAKVLDAVLPADPQEKLDDALDDTFPASDPPSQTDPTHGVKSHRLKPDEEAIRLRAYEIWEESGAMHGAHDDHWTKAQAELEAEAASKVFSDKSPASSEG